ncbi:MAG: permease-like cell division protein FtsX [bacterium]|nr:permease-like cell division protein FtsX [bacterium]
MFTKLYRLMKYSFQNFWRQRLLSIATMVVILLVLMVFQGIFVFGAIGDAALTSIREKIDISIFFEPNVSEDDILALRAQIERELAEVREVTYISRDEALEQFKARHQSDEAIQQALEELEDNPLSASLNIKTKETEQLPVVAAYLRNIVPEAMVDEISYNEDNKAVIDRLTAIIAVSGLAGLVLALFLAIVAVLVAFNTILLGIYSNRDEVSIMRLVGAPNFFIRGPFIGLGVIYGVLTATVVTSLTIPLVYVIAPYASLFVPGFDLVAWFWGSFLLLYLGQIGLGSGIGVLSSVIAINRYLEI